MVVFDKTGTLTEESIRIKGWEGVGVKVGMAVCH